MSLKSHFDISLIKSNILLYEETASDTLNKYHRKSKKAQIDFSVDLVSSFLEKGYIQMKSPIDGSPSIAIGTRKSVGPLYHLMKSESGDYWFLVQYMNFIDCIITSNKSICSFNKHNCSALINRIDKVIDYFEQTCFGTPKFSNNSRLKGFYVNSFTPFHFFYDQLKSCIFLEEILGYKALKDYPFLFEGSFINEQALLCNSKRVGLKDLGSDVYIKPGIISQGRSNASNSKWGLQAMERMESSIRSNINAESSIDRDDYDFVIWIGITGQKRSWIEQADGYAHIIKELSKYYDRLLVVVDGMTARDAENLYVPEDTDIFYTIKDKSPKNVSFCNLIGKDYKIKITICREVDFFIANAGTGCMVPLRFCKKNGVLHSNGSLRAFPADYSKRDQIIKEVEIKDLFLEPETKEEAAQHRSYHISWKVVYNTLVDVINKTWLTSLDKLALNQEESEFRTVSAITSLKKTRTKLINQNILKEEKDFPVVLKSLASTFEAMGDIRTAYIIMLQVIKLTPNDNQVRQELVGYSNKI